MLYALCLMVILKKSPHRCVNLIFVLLFIGKPELKGYRLAPLSSDEVKVINSFLKG